ncbi:MAG: bifunctional precorrin-2 dehydrogenase/sirohydrochlorin ferrochelatase [Chloroflexota bacterium]|nr:bifunctional precorrin-2 dehydrogenase/sirohydrochlorin ferrochelatase [Chloroflexota bacterium]
MPEPTLGYPVLLHLQDKQVAVIGGGRVATRKVQHLLGSGARVLVISPSVSTELLALADESRIELIHSEYRRDMLNEYMPFLVIATTDDDAVNQIVAQDAHRIRALTNVANGSSDDSDFSNMALIDRSPLVIALSSNGASPAMLRGLKKQLEQVIGDEYAILGGWLGELREPLKSQLDSQMARRALYRRILDSDVLPLLRQDQPESARRVFDEIISRDLAL